MRPHFELLKACGCKVMVFAEKSSTAQSKRNVPVADRRQMTDAGRTVFSSGWARGRAAA